MISGISKALCRLCKDLHHAGEQKLHWEKTNKGNDHLKLCMPFVCLVPEGHEWLTAKGIFFTAQEI